MLIKSNWCRQNIKISIQRVSQDICCWVFTRARSHGTSRCKAIRNHNAYCCCDPRLVFVPWPTICCPKADAAHWTTHQRPTTNRWPVIVQYKLPAEDRPLWPIRFDFRTKTDCRQKLFVKKNIQKLNNIMCKIWFCDYRWLLLYKDFLIRKSIIG